MTNPILQVGGQAAKVAVQQAVDIGKEAYSESVRTGVPFRAMLALKAQDRLRAIEKEAAAVAAYLRQRPVRAAVIALSGVVAVASVLVLRSRRRA